MKHVIVSVNISELSANQKMVYGGAVLKAMTGNADFPNPFPSLTTLQQALDELKAAITNAIGGGRIATAIMHNKEQQLHRTLKMLAAHVQFEANDDEQKVLSSGFPLRKQAQRSLSGFRVQRGVNPGEVLLRTAYKAAVVFVWQYTEDLTGESGWTNAGASTKASFKITGLKNLHKYLFRYTIINNKGQQPHSHSLMLMVV